MLRRALWISTLSACSTAVPSDDPTIAVPLAPRPPIAAPRTFRPMTNPAPGSTTPGLPQQLTDGSVLIADSNSQTSGHWWRIVPDQFGSYENGAWTAVADSPGYAPLYFGSAVLPDGRYIAEGGEYLGGQFAFTKKGAILDPIANTWTSISPPTSFHEIGDASAIVLADGRFMLTDCCSVKEMAILDPVSLTWTETVGTGKADIHDEESWAMLPDGRILTVDANAPAGDLLHTEAYDPTTQTWSSAGQLPIKLADTLNGAGYSSHEIGPEMLRPDGTVVAIGGTNHNAVYDIASDKWTALPDTPGGLGAPDGPGVVMPNGDIMIAVNPVPADGAARTDGDIFVTPVTFLELSGSTFSTTDQPPQAQGDSAYFVNFMMLPTGEVLMTDGNSIPLIYTPAPGFVEASRPVILAAPQLKTTNPEPQTDVPTLYRDRTYTLPVLRMNGINFGAYYGDDNQMSTNYPLVRVTNHTTNHVAYFRTFNHSHRSIAPDAVGTTDLDVPATAEPGLSDFEVVANGIASPPITVNVK